MKALEERPRQQKTEKLLLIDDDPSVIEALKLLLSADFETVSANCAEEGFEKFLSVRPSVVILDYMLPDGTGIDVLRKIREMDQEVSIMILTAYATPAIAEEARLLGISDFISKPFDALQFRDRVAYLFKRHPKKTPAIPIDKTFTNASAQAEIFFHDTANVVTCLTILSEMLQLQVNEESIINSKSIAPEVELISKNVQYLKFLVEQWMAFSTGATRKTEVSDAQRSIDFAVSQVAHLVQQTNINLQVEVQVNLGRFLGTHLALAQVLVNLLNNAIEAISSSTGQIILSASSTNSMMTISVSDNGRGIELNVQKRIFDLHFSTKGNGRGVGLYSCRQSIALLNGTLNVQSPGRLGGTDFVINLPLA